VQAGPNDLFADQNTKKNKKRKIRPVVATYNKWALSDFGWVVWVEEFGRGYVSINNHADPLLNTVSSSLE